MVWHSSSSDCARLNDLYLDELMPCPVSRRAAERHERDLERVRSSPSRRGSSANARSVSAAYDPLNCASADSRLPCSSRAPAAVHGPARSGTRARRVTTAPSPRSRSMQPQPPMESARRQAPFDREHFAVQRVAKGERVSLVGLKSTGTSISQRARARGWPGPARLRCRSPAPPQRFSAEIPRRTRSPPRGACVPPL